MLDVLEKYDTLIKVVQSSDEYDKDFLDDLLNFLYQRELIISDNQDNQSLIDWWIKCAEDDDND